MSSILQWRHKDEWRVPGTDFLVSVTRHSVDISHDDDKGPNRWAVYAYIYPSHPAFCAFSGDDMWQPAAVSMPLHGGPSFLCRHFNAAGNVTSVQVGADYNHLHDAHYSWLAAKDDAASVFADAEVLHRHLAQISNRYALERAQEVV